MNDKMKWTHHFSQRHHQCPRTAYIQLFRCHSNWNAKSSRTTRRSKSVNESMWTQFQAFQLYNSICSGPSIYIKCCAKAYSEARCWCWENFFRELIMIVGSSTSSFFAWPSIKNPHHHKQTQRGNQQSTVMERKKKKKSKSIKQVEWT